MMRYTFNHGETVDWIGKAVNVALDANIRVADIYSEDIQKVSAS
jgi:3-isopropylmalate dehydrogenase